MPELPNAIILRWSRAVLIADSTLMALVTNQLYRDLGPESVASRPFLVHSADSPSTLRGVGGVAIMSTVLLMVKAVDRPANFAALATIMSRVGVLLENRPVETYAGFIINSCLMDDAFDYIDDTQYQHVGATYRVEVTTP